MAEQEKQGSAAAEAQTIDLGEFSDLLEKDFRVKEDESQKLQKLVSENHLDSEVDLNGDFCSGNCRKGVCVTVDGELYSVKPETTEEFFQKEILGRLNA